MCIYMYVYVCIHGYIHVYIYISIHIYRWPLTARSSHRGSASPLGTTRGSSSCQPFLPSAVGPQWVHAHHSKDGPSSCAPLPGGIAEWHPLPAPSLSAPKWKSCLPSADNVKVACVVCMLDMVSLAFFSPWWSPACAASSASSYDIMSHHTIPYQIIP